MTAMHGSRARLVANGYDLSPFMRDATLDQSSDVADASTWANADGSQRTDKRYVPGMRDASFSGGAILDLDTNEAHGGQDAANILAEALAGDVNMVYMPQGGSFGSYVKLMLALSTGVNISTPYTDVAAATITANTSETIRGVVLADHTVQVTANGNGVTFDAGAAGMPTPDGGVGQFHAVEKGGGAGTLTVKIQHSDDGSTWVDLVTFAGVTTAHGTERVEVTGDVERYLRSTRTVSGGTWKFHASFARR